MSFNFLSFMQNLSKFLPGIAATAKEVHPDMSATETTKIDTGVALITMLAAALQDAHDAGVQKGIGIAAVAQTPVPLQPAQPVSSLVPVAPVSIPPTPTI